MAIILQVFLWFKTYFALLVSGKQMSSYSSSSRLHSIWEMICLAFHPTQPAVDGMKQQNLLKDWDVFLMRIY